MQLSYVDSALNFSLLTPFLPLILTHLHGAFYLQL